MRPSVSDVFLAFSERFEGKCLHMYLDVYSKVTTAIGCLIDSIGEAQVLDWVHLRTGYSATYAEIAAAWTTVKGATALAKQGGMAFAGLTDLRLTDDSIKRLVVGRAASFETYLMHRFPEYPGWPADAQLGLLSCAWAAGPAWAAPHFDAAARAYDFQACAGPPGDGNDAAFRGHAWLNDHCDVAGDPLRNPGLRPRNLANKILFQNAALTKDSANLVWPNLLTH